MNIRVLVPQRIGGMVPDAGAPLRKVQGRSMGCAWSVTFVDTHAVDPDALAKHVGAVLQRVVDQMSTWETQSHISRFNHAAAGSWMPMPREFAMVLACALHVARASGGALDPTQGALVTAWGFGAAGRYSTPGFVVPTEAAIQSARARGGWQKLPVDAAAMSLQQRGGMALDLSAVAKGFAVDEVSRMLRADGIAHHLVDVGGELRGAGMKPDGQPWWVDVQLPPGSQGITPSRIALHGLSVATSGDYLQGYVLDGRQVSHCIDPRSGHPVSNGTCSVTVVHEECMQADAWSTALMVLGHGEGMPVAEREQLAAQWLVREDGGMREYSSTAFRALVA